MDNNKLYASQLFKSKVPFWRVWLFLAFFSLLFLVILARAVYVQVINSHFYIEQGERRHTRSLKQIAPRGNIVDRNGLVLAESIESRAVTLNPQQYWMKFEQLSNKDKNTLLEEDAQKISKLAKILAVPSSEIKEKFTNKKRSWVQLSRSASLKQVEQIQQLKLAGIMFEKVYRRNYVLGEAAAHLIGVTNSDGEGQEGVELIFEKQLQAKHGLRKVTRDSRGNVIDEDKRSAVEAIPGDVVELTIDKSIQSYTYKILKDAVLQNRSLSGSAIVLDAKNGNVLALANYPSYDPNNRKTFILKNMRNKVLTDVFEPGSTMKPFSISAALEAKKVSPNTVIDTNGGRANLYGRVITDVGKYKQLTVEDVIKKSSNIGTVKISMMLPAKYLWEKYSLAGFGEKPEINFPGVVNGTLRNYTNWRPIEQATMAYGYGISTTLFQLARAYTVFANDGERIDINIVKRKDEQINRYPVFSKQTTDQMRHMLFRSSKASTGLSLDTLTYDLGGKSGTARKQVDGKYINNKHRALFAGIAPIDDPKIVVAVMLDEPSAHGYYGGIVAAPIFGDIVQHTLNYLKIKPSKNYQLKPTELIGALNGDAT